MNAVPGARFVDLGRLCLTAAQILDPQDQYGFSVPSTMITGDELASQVILRILFDNGIKPVCNP